MRNALLGGIVWAAGVGCSGASAVHDGGSDAGTRVCQYLTDGGLPQAGLPGCTETRSEGSAGDCLVVGTIPGAPVDACPTGLGVVGRCARAGSYEGRAWTSTWIYYWPDTEASAREACAAVEGSFSPP